MLVTRIATAAFCVMYTSMRRFVNEALVRDGFAENSVWEPDTRFANHFRALERQARAANRGCHRSGSFDDGDPNR